MTQAMRSAEHWKVSVAFWTGPAILLIAVGGATLVAVHHGRRLALFFVLLGAGCLVIALLLSRARPGSTR